MGRRSHIMDRGSLPTGSWRPRKEAERVLHGPVARFSGETKEGALNRIITSQEAIHGNLTRSAMAFVLAGGRGSRLMELTDRRAKPAVYFGGKARIIDFALSNALNSGIRRICVATQYKAHSLIRHLQNGWNFFRPERNESFDILPASQRRGNTDW